jgi:SUKH-4 immunity protein
MNAQIATPSEFSGAWGRTSLVRLAADVPVHLPPDAAEFLVQSGLPARVLFAHPRLPSMVSFERLAEGLRSILHEPMNGVPLPTTWSPYLVLGEEVFESGGALFCLDQSSGHVVRIDPEVEAPLSLVNTSVPRFATALLVATTWSASAPPIAAAWRKAIAELGAVLRGVDPEAFNGGEAFWPMIVDSLGSEEPGTFRIARP